MKKLKCPYCNQVSEWTKGQCPLCGKSAIFPGFYQKKSKKKNSGRRKRDLGIPQPWMLSGGAGMGNILGAWLRMPRWLLWLGMIAIFGACIEVSRQKLDYSPTIQLARENLSVLHVALEYFHKDCGRYPLTAEGLASLVTNPRLEGWNGPYITKLKPDPWKHPFIYSSDGKTVKLISAGLDGKEGTADDITNPKNPEQDENSEEITVSINSGEAEILKAGKDKEP